LLEFLLSGTHADFDQERLRKSTELLYNDLLRQGYAGVQFQANAQHAVKGKGKAVVPILGTVEDGRQFVIALSAPLAINYPDAASVRELQQESCDGIIVINELLVRGNLPAATREVRQRMC
jgi:hypothetical protein